ncbi:hypothetical protein LTR37_001739 [Vermiconidia calcicola]|uniref:Uncharacterized protein n=1 Tax=Vermiconidia calcicola TaxID=1690605 RepID=A0ACC3NUP6_9PEZI|nr:hypothetical protein LTR37_001739 [Vermiconidia calcicola]
MAFTTRTLLLAAALPLVLAGGHEPTAADYAAWAENWDMCKYTALTWTAIVGVLLIYRSTTELLRYIRRIANLNHGTSADMKQKYFTVPHEKWAMLKTHFIVAPLFRKRHNREFKLSAAMNVGTLPGRVQTFFLVGYCVMNAVTCFMHIDFSGGKARWLSDACSRTGRNNPLIWLLGISFDSYNMIHRWIGRIVVLEAVLHGAFWMAGEVHEEGDMGWTIIAQYMASPGIIMTGTIGVCAFIAILLQSPSIIRHAFYETFLGIHIVLVIVSIVVVWMHLEGFPHQKRLLLPTILVWFIERAWRMVTLVRRNLSNGVTKAEVEALPGDAVRVTLRIANPWKFRPGQHVYMYMPSVGLWTSHPFTLAWSQEDGISNEKALPVARQDLLSTKPTSMSLIIRRRTGFTETMWQKAERSPGGKFMTTAFVEGPYGSQSFQSYGTVMLFAAGVGITHQVPHVRDLVAAYANGTCATRKVTLVWIIQSPEHLEWIRPWMTQILSMDKRRDILRILLFVTRPRSTKEIHSPSSSVQMFPGKPDVGALIDKEQEKQVGAMAISCCGTGSLSDDCRRAMRERCQETEIDFFEEAFSW